MSTATHHPTTARPVPEGEAPAIPLPLTKKQQRFANALEARERVVFDGRIAVRRPRLLRLLAEETGASIPTLARVERLLRARMEAERVPLPVPVYQDLADFRRGITPREQVVLDGRIAGNAPSAELEAALGVSKQRIHQIADALLVEMAHGGLFPAKRAA